MMARNVVLLRVGIDSGCGGIQGPLFKDGSFEFICIPDNKGVTKFTYGSLIGTTGRYHVEYFPESRRATMARQHIHLDPEFETHTYGDPTIPKRSLRNLKPGDFLVFYCGLQKWDSESGWDRSHSPALYLAGYFEVALAGLATDFDNATLKRQFGRNVHVCHRAIFEKQRNELILVKGGPGSRLFKKAFQISGEGQDCAGRRLKVLSTRMQKIFGDFGGCVSIQRSPPRWVAPPFANKAIDFLKDLP